MIINGKKFDFENITITEMLKNLNLEEKKVVVEVNFEIIAKESFNEFILDKASKVEIVSFIGGG